LHPPPCCHPCCRGPWEASWARALIQLKFCCVRCGSLWLNAAVPPVLAQKRLPGLPRLPNPNPNLNPNTKGSTRGLSCLQASRCVLTWHGSTTQPRNQRENGNVVDALLGRLGPLATLPAAWGLRELDYLHILPGGKDT